MNYDKIIKLTDGRRVMISVSLSEYRQHYRLVGVYVCEKGKRTWKNCVNTHSEEYRKLNALERIQYEKAKISELVTKDQIYQAKLELWRTLEPRPE